MSDSFSTLRDANVARNKVWFGEMLVPMLWCACDLAGELGELLEAAGSRNIMLETADVLICTDLALLDMGMPTFPPRPEHGSYFYKPYVLMGQAPVEETIKGIVKFGLLYCNGAKKLLREALGMPGSRADKEAVATNLYYVALGCQALLYHYSYDPELAVRLKFNQTSVKNGWDIFLGEPPPQDSIQDGSAEQMRQESGED